MATKHLPIVISGKVTKDKGHPYENVAVRNEKEPMDRVSQARVTCVLTEKFFDGI